MNYNFYKESVKAERADAMTEGFMWGFLITFALAMAAFVYLIN